MTFKTQPHRYTIGLAPTSHARCRGCRRLVAKGDVRLAIHAFVRPNRGTTFTHHIVAECMGATLAADVLRAEGVRHGVRIDKRLTMEAAGLATATPGEVAPSEARAAARVAATRSMRSSNTLRPELAGLHPSWCSSDGTHHAHPCAQASTTPGRVSTRQPK